MIPRERKTYAVSGIGGPRPDRGVRRQPLHGVRRRTGGGDRRLAGAIGSPGGNAILAYVSKALIGAIDWHLPLDQAFALPNLVARGPGFAGEESRFAPALRAAMAARGVAVRAGSGEDSGLHGVLIRDGRFEGAADHRRDGVARTIDLPLHH